MVGRLLVKVAWYHGRYGNVLDVIPVYCIVVIRFYPRSRCAFSTQQRLVWWSWGRTTQTKCLIDYPPLGDTFVAEMYPPYITLHF